MEIAQDFKIPPYQISDTTIAYKMFSKGKTNVDVVTKLDIHQIQVTQFRLEYWKLHGQDNLESLYKTTKGQVTPLLKLHHELAIKRGMSCEATANIENPLSVNFLTWELYDQANKEVSRKQDGADYSENRKYSSKKKYQV